MPEGTIPQDGMFQETPELLDGSRGISTAIQSLRYWVKEIGLGYSGRPLSSCAAPMPASGGLRDRSMRGQDDDSVARILRQIIDVIVEHPHSVQICTAERNGRTSFTVLADVRDKEKLATMTTSIRRLLIAIGSRQRYKYDVLIVTPGHAKDTTTKKTSTSEACVTHGPED